MDTLKEDNKNKYLSWLPLMRAKKKSKCMKGCGVKSVMELGH